MDRNKLTKLTAELKSDNVQYKNKIIYITVVVNLFLVRQIACEFLFVFHCNYGLTLYRFQNKVRC